MADKKKKVAAKKKKKATKDSFGRPTVVTKDVLQKLEQAFAIGATDAEACVYAEICPATLYNYQNKKPDFLERKEQLKQTPILKARKTVSDALKKDVATARWFLERKVKGEFSTRVESEISGPNGAPLPPVKVTINVVDPRDKC